MAAFCHQPKGGPAGAVADNKGHAHTDREFTSSAMPGGEEGTEIPASKSGGCMTGEGRHRKPNTRLARRNRGAAASSSNCQRTDERRPGEGTPG